MLNFAHVENLGSGLFTRPSVESLSVISLATIHQFLSWM